MTDIERQKPLSTLYTLRLPISYEYEPMLHDAIRLLVIQFTMFLLYFISNSRAATFGAYAVMQLFMLMGVAMYWLVIRKLVSVTASQNYPDTGKKEST